jgi:hypothetical protein
VDRLFARGARLVSTTVAARIIAALACVACMAAGCSPTMSSGASGGGAAGDSDPGCTGALKVVSQYGPEIVRDAVEGKESEDKAETELVVFALDAAAAVATSPSDKQSIKSVASAYTRYRDAWQGLHAPADDAIVAATGRLRDVCKS